LNDVAGVKSLGVEAGVRTDDGFDRGVVAFGDLIKGFPLLDGVRSGENEARAKQEGVQGGPEDSSESHPSALAVRRKAADPFCQGGKADRSWLGEGPRRG